MRAIPSRHRWRDASAVFDGSRPAPSVDYEAATSHQLSVTVTDAGGLSRTEVVGVAVSNQNEGPTDLTVAGGQHPGERRRRHGGGHAGCRGRGCGR